MRLFTILLLISQVVAMSGAEPVRVNAVGESFLEQTAAGELVRYLNLTTEEGAVFGRGGAREIRVGVQLSGARVAGGSDAYRLRFESDGKGETLLVSGADARGVLYAAYDLLERMGLVFTITDDLLPSRRSPVRLPRIDETVAPRFAVRGLLPWPDFLNGITAWDLSDYQNYINQMLKLRMNTLMLHCYARTYADKNWSEPFLGFQHKGVGHHAFLDTSLTERWGYNGYSTDNFAFGTGDLFFGRAFGSEAARFCPDQAAVYARAKALWQDAIAYAQRHGMKVAVGFEINLIPVEIESAGGSAMDEDVIRARLSDLLSTYPSVDFVQVWFSEFNRTTPEQFADGMKKVQRILAELAPDKRIVTGGWFAESKLGELDKLVGPDVIFSTLTPHKGRMDAAWSRIEAGRERWPVPWLEFDGNLWVPQPFVSGLRTTLQEAMEAGVEGLFGIHWRTRELDANFDYLARGMWGHLPSPSVYYRDFARTRFGAAEVEIADALIDLEQLDLFGKTDSQEYSPFRHFKWARHASRQADLAALRERLASLANRIPPGEPRARFQYLLDTLEWSAEFYRIKNSVPDVQTWDDVTRLGLKESLELYARRTTTTEELGTLAALTCKYYHDYRRHEDRARGGLTMQPPDQVVAEADGDSVVVGWRPAPGCRPAQVEIQRRGYPGGEFRAVGRFEASLREGRDRPGPGVWEYAAATISATGEASPLSLPHRVAVGKADTEPPWLLVTPRNPVGVEGTTFWLPVVVRDDQRSAGGTLYYRRSGAPRWDSLPLSPCARRTFMARIPGEAVAAPGMEFYFELTDGQNTTRRPASAPAVPYGLRVLRSSSATPAVTLQLEPARTSPEHVLLRWKVVSGATPASYHILRRGSEDRDWMLYARAPAGLSSLMDDEVVAGATYQYRVLPCNADGAEGPGLETGAIHVPARDKYQLHVNCAGRDYLDPQGTLWRADHVYSPLMGWGYVDAPADAHWLSGAPVRKTDRPALFQSVRYGAGGTLTYRFDVPDGAYTLGFLTAEMYYGVEGRSGGAGTRVFSLSAEGKTLLRDFDPTAAAGPATAMEKVFTGIPVDDGRLELVFTASRDFPAVCALWLKQE